MPTIDNRGDRIQALVDTLNGHDADEVQEAIGQATGLKWEPNAPASDTHQRLITDAAGRAADIEATVAEITAWWVKTAQSDADTTAPKAAEYGAADLAIMGTAMESLFPGITDEPHERARIGLEMAVAFYTLGKVARLYGAYQQGRLPGDDSWFDLTVYSLMARRIRETGRWV